MGDLSTDRIDALDVAAERRTRYAGLKRGSGLNADKTDGYHISTAATGSDANTIYFRT